MQSRGGSIISGVNVKAQEVPPVVTPTTGVAPLFDSLEKSGREYQLGVEPELAVNQIQGDMLLGFNKAYSLRIVLDVEEDADLTIVKNWLRSTVVAEVTTTEDVLEHRGKRRSGVTTMSTNDLAAAFVNVSFSYDCIAALVSGTSKAATLDHFPPDSAFVLGAQKRAALVGDPADPAARTQWKFGRSKQNSILINIDSDSKEAVTAARNKVLPDGLPLAVVDETLAFRGEKDDVYYGHEMYGFMDGLSQPEVRGTYKRKTATGEDVDFVVRRRLAEHDKRYGDYSRPGFRLLDPGHFVLGKQYLDGVHDSTDPQTDNDNPAAYRSLVPPYPAWCENGTFVVYRRIKQDVPGFWKLNYKTAEAQLPVGASKQDIKNLAGLIGAKQIGRWWDGTPLTFKAPLTRLHYPPSKAEWDKVSEKIRKLATERDGLKNGFQFEESEDPWHHQNEKEIKPPGLTKYPKDDQATFCPFAAHIRTVNPRDSFTDIGSSAKTLNHRIIRRGNNYGPRVDDVFGHDDDAGHAPADKPDKRGLALVMYMASIEDQFEFVQRHWANSPLRPKASGVDDASDMIIGLPDGEKKEAYLGVIGDSSVTINRKRVFTTATGLGYFLLPSMSAITDVLCAPRIHDDKTLLRTAADQRDLVNPLLYQKWDWIIRYMFWTAIWGPADTSTPDFSNFSRRPQGIAYRLPDVEEFASKNVYGNPADPTSKSYLQFRDPGDIAKMAPKDKIVTKQISWQAFPKRIQDLFENSDVNPFEYAERLGWYPPDLGSQVSYPLARQQDEYCEWFAHRDADGVITRVDITVESPEYWNFLYNDEPETCLALYRKYVSPLVQLADLAKPDGSYDVYNPWNTTKGAMHLNCPPNSLGAEIYIAAEAATRGGTPNNPLTKGGDLVQCGQYGLPSRASDPTIGSDVNSLIRQNLIISLKDPVGLYLKDLDTTGWTDKHDKSLDDVMSTIVQYQRGHENYRLRVKIEVPKDLEASRGRLGECKIGGAPIAWAGQIIDASCTMFLDGIGIDGSAYLKPNADNEAVVPCKKNWRVTANPDNIVGPTPAVNALYPKPEPSFDLFVTP